MDGIRCSSRNVLLVYGLGLGVLSACAMSSSVDSEIGRGVSRSPLSGNPWQNHPIQSESWDEGIRSLVIKIISAFPAEGTVTLDVGEFREVRTGKLFPLSQDLTSKLRSLLADVDGIVLHGADPRSRAAFPNGCRSIDPGYCLTGLYDLGAEGVRITATLRDSQSGRVVSSGHVVVGRKHINAGHLNVLASAGNGPLSIGEDLSPSGYRLAVDRLLLIAPSTPPFQVEVWTEKGAYHIGETVTFLFRSSQDAYLTLLDVGTSGQLRVLFPNGFQRNNFVSAGRVYTVPSESAGFRIRIEGPGGLERIKAIASARPSSFIAADAMQEVYPIPWDNGPGRRTFLEAVVKLDEQPWAEAQTALNIAQPGKDSSVPGRERQIRPKPPKKPIDIIGTPGAKPDSAQPHRPAGLPESPGPKQAEPSTGIPDADTR